MFTTVLSLLAVCVVSFVMHQALVVSQDTRIYDGDSNVSDMTSLVHRLQNTNERLQDSLEQKQREIITLNETVRQQAKQLTGLEETLVKNNDRLRYLEMLNVHDCADLVNTGMSTSGVYNITVAGKTVQIWCHVDSFGQGWLVIQRRVDNTTDFYRDWNSYKEGFGDVTRNFWLGGSSQLTSYSCGFAFEGNDNLHAITARKQYTLRVELVDFEGQGRWADYADFAVANEDNKYRLTALHYSATAGDSLSTHNGAAFSTRDRDNDRWDGGSCAETDKGGWWYYDYYTTANLNGLYLGGAFTGFRQGIIWDDWHGYQYSLKTVVMKIHPRFH